MKLSTSGAFNVASLEPHSEHWQWIAFADVILIDEIGMLTSRALSGVDECTTYVATCGGARVSRGDFGGKSVIGIGDLHQLPAAATGVRSTRSGRARDDLVARNAPSVGRAVQHAAASLGRHALAALPLLRADRVLPAARPRVVPRPLADPGPDADARDANSRGPRAA